MTSRLTLRFSCFLTLMICAVVVEMSPMQSRHDQLQRFAPHFEADEYDFAPRFEADDDADADIALENAEAAANTAKKAVKKANKAVAEAKAAKEAKEEQKEEEEEEQEEENEDATEAANETAVVPTIGDDFLNVDPIPSDSSEFKDTASSDKPVKPKENETNTWSNHCYDGWKPAPCRLGFRHGCKYGNCWSQCNAAWKFGSDWFGGAEWCWVYEPKASNVTGTADDSDWKYLGCKTDDDCTKQFAYRKKCTGGCSLG